MVMPDEAIVLVGGRGARLQEVVADRPKPMADVKGKPFVEWLLLALRLQGVRRVVLSVGHMAEYIEEELGRGDRFGLEIVYARDPFPLGTGGAVRNALGHIRSDCFWVLNGDSYCTFDVQRLLAVHRAHHARATLWLTEVSDSSRYGMVEVDAQGAVLAFHEKSVDHHGGLINAGVYVLERAVVEALPASCAVSLERELFPSLLGRGLYGFPNKGLFIDIGTPESYGAASQVLDQEFSRLVQMSERWR